LYKSLGFYLVEAAGIEPASESVPAEASTSVALIFLFVMSFPQGGGLNITSSD